ncbi:hypothetical protein [Brevibacillus reuszeri]|uniref:hypothetical protein n=1 Tax=Brevibacillus reuszeri TaxID=54915 RepID=UPI00289B79AD|nr:hypothetical protein [Brevibacillus reuszeri]
MIRFAHILSKYQKPFRLLRKQAEEWDEYGRAIEKNNNPIVLRGAIQPIDAKLMQSEGGRYTTDDRVIYSTSTLEDGEIIEYQGKQYTIQALADRSEYCDVFKYGAKRVGTHDPL